MSLFPLLFAAPRNSVPLRLAGTFAMTSFFAVAAGCVVAAFAGDVVLGVWVRNAIAWVIGAVLMVLLTSLRPARLFRTVVLVTPLVLTVSLLSSGQSNVHRWIHLGPVTWNAAFLCLPAVTVAIAAAVRSGEYWVWWVAALIELQLCLQPDASQATAFAVSVFGTLPSIQVRNKACLWPLLLLLVTAGIAWTRPDPLQPVPEVEGILELAYNLSLGVAVLCVVSLLAVCASPVFAATKIHSDGRPAAKALGLYFITSTLMPLFGAYPVPIVGMGMSPIIGFWLGMGTLVALCVEVPDDNRPGHPK
jgi:hypothetical protein